MRDGPPFRAEHVGSLLRPPEVKRARAALEAGLISPDELTAAEDAAVDRLVQKQEAIGLKAVTDGEVRRRTWHGDFFAGLEGTTLVPVTIEPEAGKPAIVMIPAVAGRIAFRGHAMLRHFEYLAARASRMPKMTIPSPTMLVSALRDWRQVVRRDVYRDTAELYHDLGLAYRGILGAFYDAGCRYLQLDDVNLAYLCDPAVRARLRSRGDDPDALLTAWVELVNSVLAGRPDDLIVTTHVCRGNFRSTWLAEGGYEPIADALFNRFDYDGYFLEYDSERAGSFDPLRFVPAGKFVVLGLVTTKTAEPDDRGAILERLDAAARFVAVERLGLSPQCGFASTEEGNLVDETAQWAKLATVVEIAAEVWPQA